MVKTCGKMMEETSEQRGSMTWAGWHCRALVFPKKPEFLGVCGGRAERGWGTRRAWESRLADSSGDPRDAHWVHVGQVRVQDAKILEDAGTVRSIPALMLLAREQQRWPNQTRTLRFASDHGSPLCSRLWGFFFFVFGFFCPKHLNFNITAQVCISEDVSLLRHLAGAQNIWMWSNLLFRFINPYVNTLFGSIV